MKVYVGPKRKLWILNEELLCDRSDYFKAAFQGNFKEASEKEVYLEEEDSEAFAMFVNWVYGCLLRYEPGPGPSLANAPSADPFLKLYCLAEFLGIEKLMNLAIDQYSAAMRFCGRRPSAENVTYLCMHSPKNSLARKFIAYSVAFSFSKPTLSGDIYEEVIESNAEFALEVIKAMQFYALCTPSQKKFPRDEPQCNYHSHRHTKKCA